MIKISDILDENYKLTGLESEMVKIKKILIRNKFHPKSIRLQHKTLIVTMENHIAASELMMEKYKLLVKIQKEVATEITSIKTRS